MQPVLLFSLGDDKTMVVFDSYISRLKDIADGVKSLAEILAIICGGIWTYWLFVRHRQGKARINFDVGLDFIGIHDLRWVAEATAVIENRGFVRHEISEFRFEITYLASYGHLCQKQIPDPPELEFTELVRKDFGLRVASW
jgi:hypothetical protein